MKKIAVLTAMMLCLGLLFSSSPCVANPESVLEKIERTGKVTIGHREGAIPFGFYDEAGQWVGFGLDLGEKVVEALEEELGKEIEYIKKPINSKTRIPLVANGTIDCVIGSTTITLARDEIIDFVLPIFFLTGTRFLVSAANPADSLLDLAGARIAGMLGGGSRIDALRQKIAEEAIEPAPEIQLFEDTTKAFLALQQGKVHAVFADDSMLNGLKIKSDNPDNWKIIGQFVTYDPYGIIISENDSDWGNFLTRTLVHLIKDGQFYQIYDKWFGPNGEVPIPRSEEFETYLRVSQFPE